MYLVSLLVLAYVSAGLVPRNTNDIGTLLIICTISGIACLFGALCL